jgi:nucleotide-binding universal stress UspA family protein
MSAFARSRGLARGLQIGRAMSSIAPPSSSPPRVVILAAVDATTASEQVTATASRLASTMLGAELHLLHVIDVAPRDTTPSDGTFPSTTQALDEARKVLEKSSEVMARSFQGRILGHLAAGTAWREILQLAANIQADLVVVGTHDRKGIERLVLGSVAEQVAKKAQCAVLVARAKDYQGAVPEIEPPCGDCVSKQRDTKGAELWCERHASRHSHGRLHYESPPTFGVGSMLIRT